MRLDERTCRERLAAQRVARLATVGGDGRPHLVPVTFALLGDHIVTAVDQKPKSTIRLRRLRNIDANPSVCLLADHYEEDWRHLWWVRADGTATVVEDDAARRPALEVLEAKYPQYRADPPRGPVVDIEVGSWAGWSH